LGRLHGLDRYDRELNTIYDEYIQLLLKIEAASEKYYKTFQSAREEYIKDSLINRYLTTFEELKK